MRTITLSPEQQAVIDAALNGTSNIACIAAAGSGKTTMLTHLVNRFVKHSASPMDKRKRVLVLAFNKSAADDFCDKLAALDPVLFKRVDSPYPTKKSLYKASEDVARTFDSWLPTRDNREWFGHKASLCLDYNRKKREEGWLRAVDTANARAESLFPAGDWEESDEDQDGTGEDERDTADTTISGRLWSLWDKCWIHAGAYPSTLASHPFQSADGRNSDSYVADARWAALRRVFAAFERWCGSIGYWTMCDVYMSLHRKVKEGGRALQELRARLAEDYDLVIVDEAQDNNRMQNDIIQSLCWSHGRRGPRLLMVGDPRQCIYEWRGASPRQLVDFASLSSTTRIDLTINRRSLPHIVARADQVIRGCKYGPDSNALRGGPGLLREGETRESMVSMCVNLSKHGRPLGILALSYSNKDKAALSAELLARDVPHTVDDEPPGHKDAEYAAKRVGTGSAREVAERTRKAVWSVRRRPVAAPLLVALLEKALHNEWDERQLLSWYSEYSKTCRAADFNLSTIHKAKGKEKHIVIVRNPTLRDPHSEVSARMMYVAMTRAMDHLFVFDAPEDQMGCSPPHEGPARCGTGITNTNFLD